MTAARGVFHSEMPEQENGLMQGFQLWLNLPAKDKMSAPMYRSDIPAAEIPIFTDADGVRVKLIAGEIGGVTGAVSKPVTEPVFLDVELPADCRWAASRPTGRNAIVYIDEGVVQVGESRHSGRRGADGNPHHRPGRARRRAADGRTVPCPSHRGRTASRADRAVRPVGHEQPRRDPAGDRDAAAGRLGAIPPRNPGAREEIQ